MDKIIEIERAIEICGGDREFAYEIIDMTRDDVLECIVLLERAHNDKNNKEVVNISHRVKGQALNICAKSLITTSTRLEESSRDGSYTENEYIEFMVSMKEFAKHSKTLNTSKLA